MHDSCKLLYTQKYTGQQKAVLLLLRKCDIQEMQSTKKDEHKKKHKKQKFVHAIVCKSWVLLILQCGI